MKGYDSFRFHVGDVVLLFLFDRISGGELQAIDQLWEWFAQSRWKQLKIHRRLIYNLLKNNHVRKRDRARKLNSQTSEMVNAPAFQLIVNFFKQESDSNRF